MLGKTVKLGALLALIGSGMLLLTMLPQQLNVPPLGEAVSLPTIKDSAVKVAAIPAGRLTTLEAFGFRGGSLMALRDFNMGGILLSHPKGDFLIDTGLGKDYREHNKSSPFLMRYSSAVSADTTVAERLSEAGYDRSRLKGIILTHAHWDHVSGVPDLLPTPVWVSKAERSFIQSGHPMGALMNSFEGVQYEVYEFDSGAYAGFSSSKDLYGDGSVVLVPAKGHTPGSVVVFVHSDAGRRYAFIGDIAWQLEGIAIPAERPWLSRQLVDDHEADNRDMILKLAGLAKKFPDLTVVPAHDTKAWLGLPQLSEEKAR